MVAAVVTFTSDCEASVDNAIITNHKLAFRKVREVTRRSARFPVLLTTAAVLAVVVCLILWLEHGAEHASPAGAPGYAVIREGEALPQLRGNDSDVSGRESPLPSDDGGNVEPPDSTAWEYTILGVAVREDGEAAVRASVRALGAGGEELGAARSDDSGQFTLRVNLSGEAGLVCVMAASIHETDGPLKSLPWYVAPKRPPAVPASAVLILRSGAKIDGMVVSEDGSPVARATVVVVCEAGSDSAVPLPGWEVASFSEESSSTISGEDGRFALIVRPGNAVIRASRGSARSQALRARVRAGANQDVGALLLSSETTHVHLRIVEASGEPSAGAWVQLHDRTLRFGSPGAESALPTLRAGADGRLDLGRLVPSDFPLVLAAGTPTSGPVEISLSSASGEDVVIRLPQRPGFNLRVPAAACQGLSGSPFAHATAGFEQLDPPPTQGLQQMRAPAEMIAGVLQEDSVRPDSADPCVGRAYVGAEAKYRLTFALLGSSPVNLVVRATVSRNETYELPLPSGRWVRLRSTLPVGWHGDFRCVWDAGGMAYGDAFVVTADALRSGAWRFAPDGVEGVSVAHAQPALLDAATAQPAIVPARGGDVDVLVQPVKPVIQVSLGIAGGGRPLPLADWPIHVVPIDELGAAIGPGVAVRTGADGQVQVSVSASRLRVVALQRLGGSQLLQIDQPKSHEHFLLPIW